MLARFLLPLRQGFLYLTQSFYLQSYSKSLITHLRGCGVSEYRTYCVRITSHLSVYAYIVICLNRFFYNLIEWISTLWEWATDIFYVTLMILSKEKTASYTKYKTVSLWFSQTGKQCKLVQAYYFSIFRFSSNSQNCLLGNAPIPLKHQLIVGGYAFKMNALNFTSYNLFICAW